MTTKAILITVLLITLYGYSISATTIESEVPKPDSNGFSCLVRGFLSEYFYIDHQKYPFAGYCHLKETYIQNKWAFDKNYEINTQEFVQFELTKASLIPNRELKSIAYAITASKSDHMSKSEDVVIEKDFSYKTAEHLNVEIAKNEHIPFKLPSNVFLRYIIGSAKISDNSKSNKWWMGQFSKNGLETKLYLTFALSIGITMLQKGDRIYYCMVLSGASQAFWVKHKLLNQYTEKLEEDLRNSVLDIEHSNKIRAREDAAFEVYATKCANEIAEEKSLYYHRKRPGFNHYNILGELSLMREYPQILYHWLEEDKAFNKNAPHAKDILAYLKEAKGQSGLGKKCVLRDSCAWTFAYKTSINGPSFKFKSISGMDENYFNRDYEMNVHMKSRLQLKSPKTYELDNIHANDWGAYDLIVHLLLNEKDPVIWKRLLKQRIYGIDNIAFATSKAHAKWNVTVFWYDTLQSDNCPATYFLKSPMIGFQACLNKYNFYQRRWHDYDWTKGVIRKPGEGETHADKPHARDLPIDNAPRPPKTPFVPPIKPQVVKPIDDNPKPPVKPVVPKPVKPVTPPAPTPGTSPKIPDPKPKVPKLPKNKPKDPTQTHKEIRESSDKDFLLKMRAEGEVRQVISLKTKFNWLENGKKKE